MGKPLNLPIRPYNRYLVARSWNLVDHLTQQQLERYLSHKMNLKDLLIADAHLATCERCRFELLTLSPIENKLSTFIGRYTETGIGEPLVPPPKPVRASDDCEENSTD
jgi:anti-sigma factor RsiW